MGVKYLIYLVMAMVLISGCSIGGKTKPVVTDITGAVVEGAQKEPVVEEKAGNEIIPEKAEEEGKVEEGGEAPPQRHIVVIKELRLDPQELTIKRGDTVVWDNQDDWEGDEETKHYLAAHSNEFRSSVLYKGDMFEHTFNKTGTFTYIDILYKDRDYMRGEIKVE